MKEIIWAWFDDFLTRFESYITQDDECEDFDPTWMDEVKYGIHR